MLKKYEPKFSTGSLFICTKCGKDFSTSDMANKLKSELKSELKDKDAHTKIRVMTSGCLSICERDQQTFAYYPNNGSVEVYTTSSDFDEAKNDIAKFLSKCLSSKT